MNFSIGTFDGVHRGHQYLIRRLKELEGKSVVLTFSNHPAEVLKREVPQLITPLSLKEQLLREHGIDELLVVKFTESLAQLTYEEFLAPYPIRNLILGRGAVLGRGRQGTAEQLRLLGKKRGFEIHEVPALTEGGESVSSSRIRILLAQGKEQEAERLLGWPLERRKKCQ